MNNNFTIATYCWAYGQKPPRFVSFLSEVKPANTSNYRITWIGGGLIGFLVDLFYKICCEEWETLQAKQKTMKGICKGIRLGPTRLRVKMAAIVVFT